MSIFTVCVSNLTSNLTFSLNYLSLSLNLSSPLKMCLPLFSPLNPSLTYPHPLSISGYDFRCTMHHTIYLSPSLSPSFSPPLSISTPLSLDMEYVLSILPFVCLCCCIDVSLFLTCVNQLAFIFLCCRLYIWQRELFNSLRNCVGQKASDITEHTFSIKR